MQGNEQVRHCSDCSLRVYNLSAMTKAEADFLFANSSGKLCVRLFRRSDGTVILDNCPVGLRRLRDKMISSLRVVAATIAAAISCVAAFADEKAEESKPAKDPRPGIRFTWTLSESGPTERVPISVPKKQPQIALGSIDRFAVWGNSMKYPELGKDWSASDLFTASVEYAEKGQSKLAEAAFQNALASSSLPDGDPMLREFISIEYAKLLKRMGRKSEAAIILDQNRLKPTQSKSVIEGLLRQDTTSQSP